VFWNYLVLSIAESLSTSHFYYTFVRDINVDLASTFTNTFVLIYYPWLLLDLKTWGYSDTIIKRAVIKHSLCGSYQIGTHYYLMYFLPVILALFVSHCCVTSPTSKCNIVSNISVDNFWRISLLHFLLLYIYCTLLSGLIFDYNCLIYILVHTSVLILVL